MSVRIVYFASVRENMGMAGEMFELQAPVTDVKGLRAQLVTRGAPWSAVLAPGKAVRVSVNLDMARDSTPVKAGDEIAFFPPVSGG
jgi:molybdopterin synthase sulfur carrier subunit